MREHESCMCACDLHPRLHSIVLAQAFVAWLTMFQRSQQPSSSSHELPEHAFQRDLTDLYAENLISGQRVTKLLSKASRAGIPGIDGQVQKTIGRNQARAIRRHKLKNTKWPAYYWFDCRVQSRKTAQEYTANIPMMLPLDLLEVIWDLGDKNVLLSQNLDTAGMKHMAWMRQQLQVNELMAWGMHGDGVPCNYDRTESVIIISLNLPGLTGRNGRLRIPMVILPDHAMNSHSFDDIMTVVAWSMRHLVAGSRPCCRHDGTAWAKSDAKRLKKNGLPLPLRACLVQVRADWDWMGKCFHFPFHNVKEGCCWLCKCKRHQARFFVNTHSPGMLFAMTPHLAHRSFMNEGLPHYSIRFVHEGMSLIKCSPVAGMAKRFQNFAQGSISCTPLCSNHLII